ncbi:MAG: flagellar basal body P-ring formation protein FlgA [Rhizobiaceae bacterium]|nr:MAG: flagellar basal body P-ring formation protein FlgA [Rhizobiaceae bacterium]
MTFGRAISHALKRAAMAALVLAPFAVTAAHAETLGYAVVPTQIIYPGEEIDPKRLQTVEVTNKNLAQGYAQDIGEVQGLITTRTLLPGRTIMVGALRQPYSVKRGDKILLVYDNAGLRITAAGTPLADGTTGALIQVRNTDTGVILSGTVMPDRSVLVVQK